MRQSTQYTCGPECVLTLKNLLHPMPFSRNFDSLSELQMAKDTKTKPLIGMANDELIDYISEDDVLSKHLVSFGENIYNGELCIANIRNWRSGIGHYVVILKREREREIYNL